MAKSIHRSTAVDHERLREPFPEPVPDRSLTDALGQLYRDLFLVIERDPEQEILGIAIPVVDATISEARERLRRSEHTLASHVVELISADTCSDGRPVRALDAWLVIGQLLAALGVETQLPLNRPAEAVRR